MQVLELLLIGIGLSMDAFAVSMVKGLSMKRLNLRHAAVISLFFGGFQAIMPLLGWALGTQFEQYITSVDHWIAFGLLGFIGAKMLWDVKHDNGDNGDCADTLHYKELFMMAVATSIDALAVGITFAFLQTDIVAAVSIIGCITFGLSFLGVCIGHRFGAAFKSKAQIIGGCVLILIGTKILLEHLDILC